MELRHLRSFVALAEELHFGRAAQRVFLAQPALSKQISALEKELAVSLFERDKRQVVLTTAGAALLEDARRLLTQADGAVERARSAGRGATGILRIGFIAPALYDLLPPVLRVFRARHPGVRLALEEMHNIEAVNAVRSRYVQLAFVRLPIEPVSEISLVTVRSEPVMLAVPEGSALADSAHDAGELWDDSRKAHIGLSKTAANQTAKAYGVDYVDEVEKWTDEATKDGFNDASTNARHMANDLDTEIPAG